MDPNRLSWLTDPPLAVDVLVRMTVLLAAGWLLHVLLWRANPRWRTLLWRVVAVGLLATPFVRGLTPENAKIPVALPRPPTPTPATPSRPLQALIAPVLPVKNSIAQSPLIDEELGPVRRAGAREEGGGRVYPVVTLTDPPAFSLPEWPWRRIFILGLWSGVAALLAWRLLMGKRRVAALLAQSEPAPEKIIAACRKTAQSLGYRMPAEVRLVPAFPTPFLTGLRRPILLLPGRMSDPSYEKELPGIFAHELAHLHRNDLFWGYLIHWFAILLWFHPLLWKVRSAHGASCEKVADAVSASHVGDVRLYSRTLARIAAEMCRPAPEPEPAAADGAPMARKSELRERLIFLRRRVFATPLGRRSLAAAGVVALLALAVLGSLRFIEAAGESDLMTDASPRTETDRRLLEAIGYASVYNYEKVEEISDAVLAAPQDPREQALAWWVKAVAYSNFALEYRTDRLNGKLAAAKEALGRLNPDLPGFVIARREIPLRFFLAGRGNVEKVLDEIRRERIPAGGSKPMNVDQELAALEGKADALFHLGMAYWTAGQLLRGSKDRPQTARSAQYYDRARKLLLEAARLRPNRHEYAGSYVWLVGEMGLRDEYEKKARGLVDHFDGKAPYQLAGDIYFYGLYTYAVSSIDRERGKQLIFARARSPLADAWAHYEEATARADETDSDAAKLKIWAALARRMETGEIATQGFYMYVQAKTYYELAHFQSQAGDYAASLETYRKLSALSPHYARIHDNLAHVLLRLAAAETDAAQSRSLLDQARKEIDLQKQYDWHESESMLRNILHRLEKSEGA